MKIKPVFVGIAVIGALLLVLSFSTLAKVFAANPRDLLTGVKAQPLATKLLPKKSPLFLSFLVDPDKLSLFTQLAAQPSDRGDVRHEIANLKQQLKQNWLLDYEEDIQPWLDQEITLAVTDIDLDHQPKNGSQTGYLLAFAAKDIAIAQSSIDAFWQRLAVNGSDIGFEQYQDTSILSSANEDQPAIAGTILGKFVLFANDSRVIKEAINLYKVDTKSALANVANFGDRLAQINTGKIGVAYVNLAELDQTLPQESLLLSFGLDKSGIRAKTLFSREAITSDSSESSASLDNLEIEETKSSPDLATKAKAVKKTNFDIAKNIPLSSSVIIGNNLAQTLQGINNSLSPDLQKLLVQAIAPLPFNSDALKSNLFAWAQDEYAIALLPPNNLHKATQDKANQNREWLIVAPVKDAQASKTAIAVLDNQVRNQLTVGEISLKNQPITVWTKLTANSLNTANTESVAGVIVAAHAQTNNYIYLSNSLSALESALNLKGNQAIATSKEFKTIAKKLPKDRQIYGYIGESADLLNLTNNLSSLLINERISPIFNNSLSSAIFQHINILSFADSSSNVQNGELFIFFK
ncbi:DUF3352 domain-containing protein [Pseudanabaena sp. FACHB-1998]|uniref:DUF3352 domain-containing protein n=1 Tax=Pseudanabaena sp. FACHB-1998 TaxID=2692858 RepID=UPI001680EA83|nr:DUF3352 domain-containing protein [Pseudanabaena sp. FACHB-1998]MBD2175670.1 DUF3352 domain-containing protein [Pseudanabaena sp. FACHB-1998]